MSVTILGGTGLLGRRLAKVLVSEGIDVVIAGRSAGDAGVEADLETGGGLSDAIATATTIVHLASNPRKPDQVDIAGTQRLLPLVGDRHLVYMSIVGVDRHPLPYYKAKLATEQMIRESRVRFSILRATQFHHFLAFLISKMAKPLVCLTPRGYVFQPIATDEVARHLADIARTGPTGMLPDLGGPEVLGIDHLARTYMTAIGKERPLVKIPVPGKASRAFRSGLHTNPERAVGKRTWDEYLSTLRN